MNDSGALMAMTCDLLGGIGFIINPILNDRIMSKQDQDIVKDIVNPYHP